jgi:DNA-directed RNA polymerase specialized sigma24 family protein
LPDAAFPPTDWTRLARAALDDEEGRRSFEHLTRLYLPSIGYFLRTIWRLPDREAEDLVQAFVTEKLVSGELFQKADRRRGRFRNLLVRTLRHWLVDRLRGQARRPAVNVPSVDHLPAPNADAAAQFERAWAKSAVAEAIVRTLRHCERTGRMDVWHVFHRRLVMPAADGTRVAAYEDLVREFGLRTPHQAANLLISAKRLFARKLEQVVLEEAGPGADVDEELSDLMQTLALRG